MILCSHQFFYMIYTDFLLFSTSSFSVSLFSFFNPHYFSCRFVAIQLDFLRNASQCVLQCECEMTVQENTLKGEVRTNMELGRKAISEH